MRNKALKLFGVIAGMAILTITLTGCVPVEEVVEDTGPIQIGAILPLTGDGAAYGVPMQRVAQIAIDKINSEGGVNGRDLEFIWEDGKCNGKDSATAAQKLINVDKVQVIYGGFCSSETLGAAPIAEAAKVVMLSAGSSSPDVTKAGDYIFRNYPSDSAQGTILAGIADKLKLKKVGMLTEENDYTLGIDKVFKEKFSGETVSENFLPTDTDFKTQITKLKGAGVDALFLNPQTAPKTDLLFKQLQEQGFEGQLFANDVAMGYREGITTYKDLVEDMISAEPGYDESHPNFAPLVSEYKRLTGALEVPYLTYATTSFDAVYLLLDALKAVGNNADAIKEWLYTVDGWKGTAGSLTLDSNGDPAAGHKPKIVKDGEVVLYE